MVKTLGAVFLLLICSVVAVSAQTKKLKIISKPLPAYTSEARDAGLEGEVVLRVTFLADGTIGAVRDDTRKDRELFFRYGLTANAIKAARAIEFEPQTVDGIAVTVVRQIIYVFDVH